MKVAAEIFKGIEFIRVSNLPEDQKEFIIGSIPKERIIMILKDNVVMKDCIQYHDYISLYNQHNIGEVASQEKQLASQERSSPYKFAFK